MILEREGGVPEEGVRVDGLGREGGRDDPEGEGAAGDEEVLGLALDGEDAGEADEDEDDDGGEDGDAVALSS